MYEHVSTIRECDVLVVGGGPAGCAAAVRAARTGAKTLLIERSGMLGGATVNQDVIVLLSQNGADLEGIWQEYMARLFLRGGAEKENFVLPDPVYYKNFPLLMNGFLDPNVVRLVWDELIEEAGAELLLHAAFADVIKDGSKIESVIVGTRAGLCKIRAKVVIDCTGDGLVANAAGASWEQGSKTSKCAMSLTKVIRLGGIKEGAGRGDMPIDVLREKLEKDVASGVYRSGIMTSGRVLQYIHPKLLRYSKRRREIFLVTSRVLNADPTSAEDITRAEREGLRSMYEVYDFYKRYVPGCEDAYIAHLSNDIGVRSSRRVHGRAYVTDEDAITFQKCEDSIARASWQLDVWPSDSYTSPAGNEGGIKSDEERTAYKNRIANGDYFDIPYGAILSRDVDNLMLGGRIISASHLAEASLRIQQTCMCTGEAAGYAAAKAVQRGVLPFMLDGKEISRELRVIRDNTLPAWDKLTVEFCKELGKTAKTAN